MKNKNLQINEKYLDNEDDIKFSDNNSIEIINPERTDDGILICPESWEDDWKDW